MLDLLKQGRFLPHRPLTDNALNYEGEDVRGDDYAVPGIYKWWSCDTESRFKHNLNVQDENWHYRTKQIVYNVNSSGYRCPEWDDIDWENSAVIFGCSETFGTGLAEDETISAQLSELLSMPVINMGKNGTSIEYNAVNNLILRKNFPTPKLVINYWTSPMRETYTGIDKIVHVLPRHEIYYKKHFSMLFNMLGLTAEDIDHNYQFRAKCMSDMCKIFWANTNYVELTWDYLTAITLGCHKREKVDNARDIAEDGTSHSGRQTALNIAKYIAGKMQ